MKILVIDDEKSIRMSLQLMLDKLVTGVYTAESGEQGLELFARYQPDLVIVDIKLPGIDGLEVLRNIKKTAPGCTVIVITYLSDLRLAVDAMKMGAYDYFTKPFKLEDIKNAAAEIVKRNSFFDDFMDDPGALKKMISKHGKIRDLVSKVLTIARLDQEVVVLITGESGTGKEIIARTIHYNSARAAKPFVAINCPAIPKNLQESELFGYEKGAFTDARTSKAGLLEEGNEGTVFFDEIGDMDTSLQAKLLRVIQEKKFRRLGSNKEKALNANIICSTNKNLQKEISQGAFRLDFYYRINVVPINLPPLRERKEDLPVLLNEFIQLYNHKFNKKVTGVSDEAMKVLQCYEWPGNIRELKNVVERVMIFQKNDIIMRRDLPEEILRPENRENVFTRLDAVEEETIFYTLEKNNWNISVTAKELGISRLTLRRRIEKYGLRDK